MKQRFVPNDAIGKPAAREQAAPLCGEEEACFKLGAISPEPTAAGQFTSGMNNAQTLGREPPSALFSATMDGHPSLEMGGREGGDV